MRDRLGAAGANLQVDAVAVEDRALEGELLDRRRAGVEGPEPVAPRQPRGRQDERQQRHSEPQQVGLACDGGAADRVRAAGRWARSRSCRRLDDVEHPHPALLGELGLVSVEHVKAGLVVLVGELEDPALAPGIA